MKQTGSQTAFTVVLISEHNQGLHEEKQHPMCRMCHPDEAKLLDSISDVHSNE